MEKSSFKNHFVQFLACVSCADAKKRVRIAMGMIYVVCQGIAEREEKDEEMEKAAGKFADNGNCIVV
ncbi:MAG: hypothetical protein HFI74_00865 [Lachnospiraceae bacterium]|jgi:hypothetical protein|nr:hypothetical protein [Lachnospiraceae bacterium]